MTHRLIRIACVAAAISAVAANPSWSQSYPIKPVRIVVAGPPGGGNDVITRPLAQKLSEALGEQFILDHRPGAGTVMAGQATLVAPPDGYTILMGTIDTMCISPYLVKKRPYDPVHDFTPVTLVASAGLMLAVNPQLPASSMKELIGLAKARPGQLLYASNGTGSLSQLTTELFSRAAGITMVHVPYKGGTPAAIDTIGGQTQLVITAIPTLIAHVKASRLRALAVTAGSRSAALPDLPTIAESGIPGFESRQWYAVFAPKNTPEAIVEKLYREIAKAAESTAVRNSLSQTGAELSVTGPEALGKFLQADCAKWRKAIGDFNIVLD